MWIASCLRPWAEGHRGPSTGRTPPQPIKSCKEGDHGRRFFETEPITTDIEIGMAMQFDMTAAQKKAPPAYPQRRCTYSPTTFRRAAPTTPA